MQSAYPLKTVPFFGLEKISLNKSIYGILTFCLVEFQRCHFSIAASILTLLSRLVDIVDFSKSGSHVNSENRLSKKDLCCLCAMGFEILVVNQQLGPIKPFFQFLLSIFSG